MDFVTYPLIAAVAIPALIVSLLATILPLLASPAGMRVSRVILNLNAWVDGRGSLFKQIAAAVITILLTFAGFWLAEKIPGAKLPTTLEGFDVQSVVALINTIGAWLLHRMEKDKEAAQAKA